MAVQPPAGPAGLSLILDGRAGSWVVAAAATASISALFAAFVPDLWHWMLIPVSICGVLIGVDAVDWLRDRLDLLEPAALIGLFGFHLFYLAPLLHVAWNYWPVGLASAADWRQSLGTLAVVNASGLVIYRFGMSRLRPSPQSERLQIDEPRFANLSVLGVLVAVLTFGYVVFSFGGPAGYVNVIASDRDALAGYGWLLLIGEAWPLLLFALILVKKRHWFRAHHRALLMLLIAFATAELLTGGLRGSRANTIWPVLMAVGMIHLLVRRVRRQSVVVGALILVAFMYVYGFYKTAGAEVLDVLAGSVSASQLSSQTGRTLPLLLLEDFGRAGTQALIVDRQHRGAAERGHGITYLGDVANLVPSFLVPNPPPDKVVLGTDTLYGSGSWDLGVRSSRIYGLTGEGMLNFGLVGGVIAFVPFTSFMWCATRWYRSAHGSNALGAQLLAPSLGIAAILALGSDFDNVVWFALKQVLPLAAIVWWARLKTPRLGSHLAAVVAARARAVR